MKNIIGILLAAILIAGVNAQSALGLAEFKKAFTDKYAAKHKSKEFQSAVKKASCNVCHVKGAKKTVHNDYGKMLAKLIEGSAKDRKAEAKKEGGLDAQNEEKAKLLKELEDAFAKVEKAKSDEGKGPEYGKLIESGKLPVDVDKAVAKYKAEKAKAEKEGVTAEDAEEAADAEE